MNVVILPVCKNSQVAHKHGDFEYFQYSINTWKYWCNRHNAKLVLYDTPTQSFEYANVNWQRWFDLESLINDIKEDVEMILLADASIMVKWDAPNFFDMVPHDRLTAFPSEENFKWVCQSIDGYTHLFPDVPTLPVWNYINSGFQIFPKSHLEFLNVLKEFYQANRDSILEVQNTLKRGTDQPVYNWLLTKKNAPMNLTADRNMFLMHLDRFCWTEYNWQFGDNRIPHFINYGYCWCFSGTDRRLRNENMKQVWDLVKHNYR